jgi:hypothetical protein
MSIPYSTNCFLAACRYASTRRAIATARAELDELLRAAAAEVLPASGGSNNSSGLRSALRTPAGKDGPGNTAAGVGGTVKGGTGQLQQQQRDSSTSRDQAGTEGPPTPPPASPLRGKSSGPQEAVHNGSHSPMRYNTRYGGGNSSTTAGAGGATIPTTQLPPRSSGIMRRVTFDGDTEALSSPAAAVKPMLQGSSEVRCLHALHVPPVCQTRLLAPPFLPRLHCVLQLLAHWSRFL